MLLQKSYGNIQEEKNIKMKQIECDKCHYKETVNDSFAISTKVGQIKCSTRQCSCMMKIVSE